MKKLEKLIKKLPNKEASLIGFSFNFANCITFCHYFYFIQNTNRNKGHKIPVSSDKASKQRL